MGSAMVVIIIGLLLLLAAVTGLLALQIWLAGRPGGLWGFIQPGLWFLAVGWGNLVTRAGGPNPSMESGVYGWGAIVMGVLSLATFLFARWRIKRHKVG